MARYKFYTSRRWAKTRRVVIARDQGLCKDCKAKGIVRAGTEVHHIVEVNDKNCNDWDIVYNPKNLKLLCFECHEITKSKSTLARFITPPPI